MILPSNFHAAVKLVIEHRHWSYQAQELHSLRFSVTDSVQELQTTMRRTSDAGVTLEDLVEGGVEEEVVIPDPVAQGHGVEAVLAAEQEKAVGGVGNAVPLTLADPHHSHAEHAAQDSPAGLSAGGAKAMDAAKTASRSKLAELLRSMAGQKKGQSPVLARADGRMTDSDHAPLLTSAGLAAKAATPAIDGAHTGSFSHHVESVQDQTGAFRDTFSQVLLFGMPFVVICAGAGVVYLKRSGRSLTGYYRPSHVQSLRV